MGSRLTESFRGEWHRIGKKPLDPRRTAEPSVILLAAGFRSRVGLS
jgi:hypothetical protein